MNGQIVTNCSTHVLFIEGFSVVPGNTFGDWAGKMIRQVSSVKFNANGLLALKEYVESMGYVLGKPDVYSARVNDNVIRVFSYTNRTHRRLNSEKLKEILTLHIIPNSELADTNLIYGLIFLEWKSIEESSTE